MKARFRGEDGGDRECVVFGQTFPEGEWVEVEKPTKKLVGNPMFETDENNDDAPDDTIASLRADLTALGVAYHHAAGVTKLTALLAEATKPTE